MMDSEINHVDCESAVVEGNQDETAYVSNQIAERTPYHVWRMLNGCSLKQLVSGHWELRTGCGRYLLSDIAARVCLEVTDRIQREVIAPNGLRPPFSSEDVCRIFNETTLRTRIHLRMDPRRLRVLFLRFGPLNGCTFYRGYQPVKALHDLDGVVWAEESAIVSYRLLTHYDVIVAPRASNLFAISVLREAQEAGKLIVFETDDFLSKIPDWNPNKKSLDVGIPNRNVLIGLSDGLIVSTEELREQLGRPDVTHVCHNAIDPELWPVKVMNQDTKVVRILWAGTATHQEDLEQIIPCIHRLKGKYRGRIQWVMVGYCHEKLKIVAQIEGRPGWMIRPEYHGYVVADNGCHVMQWPAHLAAQGCHMSIAPLAPHVFNECKSELKVIESWALGIPCVASNIAPYARAITNNQNGILLGTDPLEWEITIERMVADGTWRAKLAEAGIKTLRERYLISSVVRDYERALLKIANGRVARPECNAAIEKRLSEIS